MSSELKNYPPSEEKLRKLRSIGNLSRSKDLLFVSVFASVVYVLMKTLFQGFFVIRELFLNLPNEQGQAALEYFRILFKLSLLKVLLPMVLLVLFIGFLQNRFFINFGLISPDFSRLFSFKRLFENYNQRMSWIFVSIASLILGYFIFINFFNSIVAKLPSYFESIKIDSSYSDMFSTNNLLAVELVGLVLFSMFILGLFARVVSVIIYRSKHSMSRAELEAEARESERRR